MAVAVAVAGVGVVVVIVVGVVAGVGFNGGERVVFEAVTQSSQQFLTGGLCLGALVLLARVGGEQADDAAWAFASCGLMDGWMDG